MRGDRGARGGGGAGLVGGGADAGEGAGGDAVALHGDRADGVHGAAVRADPLGWLAVIAPHNADVWSRALVPLGEAGPAWAPITLDPIATRVEVLEAFGVA